MSDDGVQRESREIEGSTYHVILMSTSQAILLGDKLLKLAGPVLESMPKPSADAKVDMPLVIEFLSKSLSKLDGKKLLDIIKEVMWFCELAQDTGDIPLKSAFDTHFRRRFDVLTKLMQFFIEVQYGSFSKLLSGESL